MHGSTLTPEEVQVIDNKQGRLQKLISAFEHQADIFLFQQGSPDDVALLPVCNYSQYDHPHQPDISMGKVAEQLTPPDSHPIPGDDLDGSGMNPANSADLLIPLPSTLGWEWCVSHEVQSLALKEAQLRLAQANESIHKICLALGFKSAIYRTQVRLAKSQKKKTHAWTAIQGVETTVAEHARICSMAQDAYQRVHPAYPDGPELPQLLPEDLHVATLVLGSEQTGQQNKQQSWIWSFGNVTADDGTWMNDCK